MLRRNSMSNTKFFQKSLQNFKHKDAQTFSLTTTFVTHQTKKDELNGSYMKFSKAIPAKNYGTKRREDYEDNRKNKAKNFLGWQQNSSRDEGKRWLVEQQLKELELMDISNVDHVLDIEEILHYYSRLTCPAYLDIVDKFLMDIYAEFLGPPGTPCSVNSRQTTLLPSL
ncbi:uncharacterized protein LOC110610989 [Manihot esculenta]|uniref:uncharacterized protein LOC110610989 n=1 Tax=Manihot esculenta TaxID=3983 RepID=UPI001CC443C6|nr:uncharacterized protein LOC110610989 [Manihot esculenta]